MMEQDALTQNDAAVVQQGLGAAFSMFDEVIKEAPPAVYKVFPLRSVALHPAAETSPRIRVASASQRL